jgi:hypothetical protein
MLLLYDEIVIVLGPEMKREFIKCREQECSRKESRKTVQVNCLLHSIKQLCTVAMFLSLPVLRYMLRPIWPSSGYSRELTCGCYFGLCLHFYLCVTFSVIHVLTVLTMTALEVRYVKMVINFGRLKVDHLL